MSSCCATTQHYADRQQSAFVSQNRKYLYRVHLRGDQPQHLYFTLNTQSTHSTPITTFSHAMTLNVFALGASKNIG